MIFVPVGKKVYVINILGLADSFDNLTGDFEQIIEAISFN